MAPERFPLPDLHGLAARMVDGQAPQAPAATFTGYQLQSVTPESSVVTFHAREHHLNPVGTVHGGILTEVADYAMGMLYIHSLQAGEAFTTVELNTRFLRPVRPGPLTATARFVNRAKRSGVLTADITGPDGRVLAVSGCTCVTLRER